MHVHNSAHDRKKERERLVTPMERGAVAIIIAIFDSCGEMFVNQVGGGEKEQVPHTKTTSSDDYLKKVEAFVG